MRQEQLSLLGGVLSAETGIVYSVFIINGRKDTKRRGEGETSRPGGREHVLWSPARECSMQCVWRKEARRKEGGRIGEKKRGRKEEGGRQVL